MLALFFTYPPKAGGTSLRRAAKQIFPQRKILMPYGGDV